LLVHAVFSRYTARMTEKLILAAVRELSAALAATGDNEEIQAFFSFILTKAEIKAIAARWILVKEIAQGTPQRDIAKKHSLSLCKITRGSRELKRADSLFRRMLARSGAQEEPRVPHAESRALKEP
jgi:TrpR family trp operon transcriptional repressor